MSTDPNPTSAPDADITEPATPARYIWAGIVTVLSLILACTIVVLLLGRFLGSAGAIAPTPAPGSGATIVAADTLVPGVPFSVSGSGFVPGETVEVYFAPSPTAPFAEFVRLGGAQVTPEGTFVIDNVVVPPVNGPGYLVARGSVTGFSTFTPVTVQDSVPVLTPEVPATGVPPPSGPLSDLIVVGASIELETGGSCVFGPAQLGTRVVVQNVGAAPTGPFFVQVNNTQQLVGQGLLPGAIFSLWVPGYAAGDTVVIVDPTNQVPESNENNNQFIGPLPIPTLPPICTQPPGPTVIVVTPTPNPNPTGAWFGQYFNNVDLVPPAVFEQNLNALSINWGSAAPGPGVQRNGWSATFNSTQNFATTDNYLFTLTVDGGARLFIDGVLVIDEWRVGGVRTVSVNRSLVAGFRQLRVDYFKSGATARLGLTWKVSYSGWQGRYFNNLNREGPPALKRDDAEINFDWGFGSPAPEIQPDNFSADWQRSINLVAGEYLFTIDVDDGARLFVNNQVVIDSLNVQGPQILTATRTLAQGSHFFQVQYVEFSGNAKIRFTYERVIPPPTPTSPVVPTATPSPTPTDLPVTIIVLTDTPPPVIMPTIVLPSSTPPPVIMPTIVLPSPTPPPVIFPTIVLPSLTPPPVIMPTIVLPSPTPPPVIMPTIVLPSPTPTETPTPGAIVVTVSP